LLSYKFDGHNVGTVDSVVLTFLELNKKKVGIISSVASRYFFSWFFFSSFPQFCLRLLRKKELCGYVARYET